VLECGHLEFQVDRDARGSLGANHKENYGDVRIAHGSLCDPSNDPDRGSNDLNPSIPNFPLSELVLPKSNPRIGARCVPRSG
jgi:hypothetical protein